MSDSFHYCVEDGHIRLSGMVDRFTVNKLLAGIDLTRLCAESLIVDFSEVHRVDTAGLAWLLKVMGHARQSGQSVQLRGLSPQLCKLARTSGVEQFLSDS